MRYETLYFQPRQKPRNICDPASSKGHNSGVLHGKNNFFWSNHSLGVSKPQHKFGGGSSRRLGIRLVPN